MAISPEEILANAMAPVSAAVNSYGDAQVNLAQQQFMNQLRQEAEARKNQYEMGQIQLQGKLRGENDLATQALRNSGELEQVAARGATDLANKKELLPLEHKNRLEEIDQQAKAFLSRMDEAEKAKLRQSYAGMGFRQDVGESDDDFLLRVNKGVADRANKIFSTISENDGRAQSLLTAETKRLNDLAMGRAMREWATTLDEQGRRILYPKDNAGNPLPPKTPEDVIASQKDQKKRAQLAADWSDVLAKAQEKAKLSMDPSVANQINSLKYVNQHLEGALTKTLEDRAFAGATPYLKFNAPAAATKAAPNESDIFKVTPPRDMSAWKDVPPPPPAQPAAQVNPNAVISLTDIANPMRIYRQAAGVPPSPPQSQPSPQDVFSLPAIPDMVPSTTRFAPPELPPDFWTSPRLQPQRSY